MPQELLLYKNTTGRAGGILIQQKGTLSPFYRLSVPRRSAHNAPLLHVVLHSSVSHKGFEY